jgi:hypothetical protein
MKNLIVALAVAVFALTATAGEKAPAQAPVKPVAKAEACTTCKTVEVARKANLRERRNLAARRLLGGVRNRAVEVVGCATCK